jgi:hypothetical protein
MKLVLEKQFGKMAVLKGSRIQAADLQIALSGLKTVPEDVYAIAKHFSF